MSLLITSTDLQKVKVTINATAADGASAIVTNQTWTVTSGDATLDVSADGNSAFVISGVPGVTSTITVAGTADDSTILTEDITYSVTASTTATVLNLTAEAPVSK